MNLQKPWPCLLLAPAIALLSCAPASAQIGELRKSDDQFIQGLREQGMSDLLEHFVESDPPQDPIAQAALEVALKEFVAADLLKRASEANAAQQYEQANQLFVDSRRAFEDLLAAQRKLIKDNPEDERLPLWQTDFAEILLFQYLPRYYQNVEWVYEFGQPSDEQRAAYASAVTEAYVNTAQAYYTLDNLAGRVAANAELRPKLEALGIWFKLEEYTRINTPYWMARAAHGVSLLPADNAYYTSPSVRGQKNDPAAERERLRYQVVDLFTGALTNDERTKLTAQLYSGRTLVWSDKIDDIDDGVDLYLEQVIQGDATGQQGYLATLGKAVGRWKAKELDTSLAILGGMDRNQFVEKQMEQGNITPRLLAADLMFKILSAEAKKKPPSEQPALIAAAYEKAYGPLIGASDQNEPFRNVLFDRWATTADQVENPADLPPAVRMGVGERLTQQGGGLAQQTLQIARSPEPQIPAEAERWHSQLKQMREEAEDLLNRAAAINKTLIGEDMEGPVLASGLFNLGMNKYWLAELDTHFNRGGSGDIEKYVEIASLWLELGRRVPDAPNVKNALIYGMGLAVALDQNINKGGVVRVDIRNIYKGSFELLNERWPNEPAVNDQRVYAGFNLYEATADFDAAVRVYDALPSDHRDYFQARRQMIYVLQRQYRKLVGDLRTMEAKAPAEDPPPGVDPAEHRQAQIEWGAKKALLEEERDRLRGNTIEEAELIILDAEEAAKNGRNPVERFEAATAMAASRVVLAGMEADRGAAQKGLELLNGFEEEHAPDSPLGELAGLQPQPDAAKLNLRGLIQSAQQQRILILLEAELLEDMVTQAREMMDQSPDVAAGVVNGVLQQIRTSIERERRAEQDAVFPALKQEARQRIKFLATGAVKLGELLVQWAKDQGFDNKKMVAYRLPLVDSLLLADRAGDALAVMKPIVEEFPNNLRTQMLTGQAYLAVYRKDKKIDSRNGAMNSFSAVINYYNQRPNIPKEAPFWEAWYHVLDLLEVAGGSQAAEIPKHAQMLLRVDPELGGPAFKDKFLEVFERNGGIKNLPKGQ